LDKRARVGQVYNLMRTARLNVLYYEILLSRWTKVIRLHDVLVAAAGTASPFAFLNRSSAPFRAQAWFYITIAAGVIGVLKPILRLDRQVSLYSELVTHYRELFHDLKCIADDVESAKDFNTQMDQNFVRCRLKEGDLQKKEPPPNRRRIKKLQLAVEAEYNVENWWYPD